MSTQITSRKFTSQYIAALKPNTTVCDISDPVIAGLVLRVTPAGTKAWLFRFKCEGTPTRITLGKFPALGLAEARHLATKNREWLDKGVDPRMAADRFGAKTRTERLPVPAAEIDREPGIDPGDPNDFERRLAATPKDSIPKPDPSDHSSVLFIAYEYIEKWFKAQSKNSKEACRILRREVLPKWHWRDGRTITSREVIELLDVVVKRGSRVMANRLAQVLGHMFRFAIHRAILTNSPVQLLYRPGGKERRGRRVLNEDELRSFVRHREEICQSKRRAHVLMVLLLTVQRRGELGLAEWDEFDFENKRWKIPGTRTKNRREHAVPLSDWAITELMALKQLANGSRFVLPGKKSTKPANPKLITRGVKRLLSRFAAKGIGPFTPHDIRRTARTTLSRLGVTPFVAERVINHSKDVLEETYDLWDYFEEKREALDRLEHYLLTLRDDRAAAAGKSTAGMSTSKRTTAPQARKARSSNHRRSGTGPERDFAA